ncbi:Protection of telomeres protein [Paramyrothecium foliicola]|nr:Protection of telomeres protein [Paramyrothecium foliicola]
MAATRLPSGFVTVQDVLDGKCSPSSKVNIVGIITDFRAPLPPRGPHTDWKAEIQFYDKSTEDDPDASLSLHIFRPKEHIPDFGTGDIVVVIQAKVQRRAMHSLSLITNISTDIHVFSANQIPRPPANISVALIPPSKKVNRQLTESELKYVAQVYQVADKSRVPTQDEYEVKKIQSTNVRDKFRQLKDVQDGIFCDLVVQVVKNPYDLGERVTLWVSDYTENKSFFNHSFSLDNVDERRESDPFGYGAWKSDTTKSEGGWTGPFGKRSLQLTCFEPHASAIRNCNISQGSWIMIRNVQVKFGHNFSNLEGYLREDRATPLKVNIFVLDLNDELDERLKEAIRRKREYEKSKKNQLRSIVDAAKAGQKRKADMAEQDERPALRAKTRRREKRFSEQKSKADEAEAALLAELNKDGRDSRRHVTLAYADLLVKCENNDKAPSVVADALKQVFHDSSIDGQSVRLPLPFVNLQYRLRARVVDYRPSRLEEFARLDVTSEYDILSDAEDSSSNSDSDGEPSSRAMSNKWEWRFFLKLEEATAQGGRSDQSIWVMVDNAAAQCLLDHDASDLNNSPDKVDDLRQRLFLLWGELEEHKSQQLQNIENIGRGAKRDRPPSDSDDEGQTNEIAEQPSKIANRPFSCCIQQYGVKVREADPTKADAGKGRRWERVFRLFGTRICIPKSTEHDGSS